MAVFDTVQNLNFKSCTFVGNVSTGAMFQPSVNSTGNVVMSNCLYYNNTTPISLITKNATGSANITSQQSKIDIYQPNNVTYDYRRFNYFHYSQSDLATRKRGITTYRIKPEIANTTFYNYFTLNGIINTPQRIKGSLQFDANYGNAYPPSISFVGAGVSALCACAATPNVWQDFDVTLNPTSTDDITMTITCRSSATNGYVWLDGVPIYPFIQTVRHYGFLFDAQAYRTVNTHNTLTESSVASLTSVNNLDHLYDAATYWSVTNPLSTSYVDVVTVDGTNLNFNGSNITVDKNASTAFTYASASNTVTIKSTSLNTLSNFNTVTTTGNVVFNNNAAASPSVIIRSANYDSELIYSGVDSVVIYGSLSDALNSINPGLSSTNGVVRFKYGTTTQGVPMSGTVYAKWVFGAYGDVYAQTLNLGTNNTGDIALQAGYAVAANNMNIINQGVQKASILVPHTTNVTATTGLAASIQTLINDQQIINAGLKKASLLVPHITNI